MESIYQGINGFFDKARPRTLTFRLRSEMSTGFP